MDGAQRDFGRQVVLVHGITGSRRFFSRLEERLRTDPAGAETLSFDLLGFGENRDGGGAYAASDQLRHISDMITRRFPAGRVALIGHSLGGILALCWAAENRSRAGAIVLLNTPLGESKDDICRSLLGGRPSWATLMLRHRRWAHLLCVLLRGGRLMRLFRFMKPRWVPEEIFRDYTRHTWRSLERTFDQVLLGIPAAPLVRQITTIPILNLAGNQDDEISRRIIHQSNVENQILPGGHLMLLEHPEQTIGAIEEFLL